MLLFVDQYFFSLDYNSSRKIQFSILKPFKMVQDLLFL